MQHFFTFLAPRNHNRKTLELFFSLNQRLSIRPFGRRVIHCIYVSVTKPTCSALGDWLNTDSFCSTKVTRIDVKLCSMALSSMLCAPLDGRSIVSSICNSKKCRSLDVSVLVSMPSGIDSCHRTGPRATDNVNSRSTLCSIGKRKS